MRIDKIIRKGRTIELRGSFRPTDLRRLLDAANSGVLSRGIDHARLALSEEEQMPMNRSLYPDNWEQIALEVKEESGWTCQECLRPCRMRNEPLHDFVERIWRESDGAFVYSEWWESRGGVMKDDLYELVEEAPQRFTLTVAHLDHNPANCAPENLRALCSVCHLRYDAEHHAANAAETRRRQAEEAGQLQLLNGGQT